MPNLLFHLNMYRKSKYNFGRIYTRENGQVKSSYEKKSKKQI